MSEAQSAKLLERLERHYTSQREVASISGVPSSLVEAMLAEDARAHEAQHVRIGMPAFVAAQVRYIPLWIWVAQIALIALMFAMTQTTGETSATKAAIGVLSAITVLVGVPTIHASKRHGVAELEYACYNNTPAVLVARLIVLGCSSSLAVAIMIATTAHALDTSAFTVALWACPPFFLSCAGTLTILRKTVPETSVALSVVWVGACSAVLVAASMIFPNMYAQASRAMWICAAALALVWLTQELVFTFRGVCAGLDFFTPQTANSYN